MATSNPITKPMTDLAVVPRHLELVELPPGPTSAIRATPDTMLATTRMAPIRQMRIERPDGWFLLQAVLAGVMLWPQAGWTAGFGGTRLGWAVVLVTILWVSVTVHELAHAVVGVLFGLQARITATGPLLGLTELSGEHRACAPEDDGSTSESAQIDVPWPVLLAGPVSNLLIAGAAWTALPRTHDNPGVWFLLSWLVTFNLLIGLFNLLPIPSLDGGQILLSLARSRDDAVLPRVIAGVGFGICARATTARAIDLVHHVDAATILALLVWLALSAVTGLQFEGLGVTSRRCQFVTFIACCGGCLVASHLLLGRLV